LFWSRLADVECDERGCAAVIPLRKGQKERKLSIPRSSTRWRNLYCLRSAVEREFGRLKHQYGLAFLRVRGVERVRLHADLTMLARLALAVSRAHGASQPRSWRTVRLDGPGSKRRRLR
jgi:Transposase DDE domain